MFPSLRTLCLTVSTACLSAVPAFAKDKDVVPDWVRAAMAQPQPKFRAEDTAAVLLDDTVLSVANDGRATEHRRRVVKILRPAGREESMVVVPFDKDRKLISLHVWSVGPDGHEYSVKDSEVGEFGYNGGGEEYSDMRYKMVKAPGRDPGGVVAYEYEQQTRPYINEDTWFFQDDLPHLKQSYTLQLPAGFTYETVWAHHDKTQAVDLEHQRWRWEMTDTPPIDVEDVPLHPPSFAMAGRMTVHYGQAGVAGSDNMGTWQGIGVWYGGLTRDRIVATPEIAAKSAELTAGKTDFFDKSEAIGEFVQKQVRYFAVEMGVGGYQPHPAAQTFHNLYGDCKDKATLLATMLQTVGVHAVLVIVDDRRGVIDPAAPSVVADHAIAAIEVPPGYESPKLRSVVTAKTGRRYLIFDPTWEKTAFGQLERNLQGGYGILMEGDSSQIIALPVLKPESNTVFRSASFQLQPDGELKGNVVVKTFGDLSEASRRMYSKDTLKEQTDSRNRTLGRDFNSFTVTDVKVENVEALNKELTTSYTLDAEHFGRPMGALLMVRPRVLGTDSIYVDRKPRKMPIDLREVKLEKDEFSIELPSGYAVDELPEPVKLDLGFAAYESSSTLTGNKLRYTRTYTVREVTLPADRYADVQKLAAVIDADERNSAVFKKQ